MRSIVDGHGGTVLASSSGPRKGSTFRFEIPIGTPADRRFTPERSLDAVGDLRGVRVLVVDDAPDERELFFEILTRAGATVETADGTASALALVTHMRPDVIVSDIAMPDEDGYVFLRKLRAHPDPVIAATPAVAVTAHARAEDRQNAFAAGFQRLSSRHAERPCTPSVCCARENHGERKIAAAPRGLERSPLDCQPSREATPILTLLQ